MKGKEQITLNNINEQFNCIQYKIKKIVFFKLLNTIPSPIRRNVKLRGDYCTILPFLKIRTRKQFSIKLSYNLWKNPPSVKIVLESCS